MKPMLPVSQPPVEWRSRCQLALSILNQRNPSEHTADMARYALMGASMDNLMLLDSDR